jgi:membrane protein implicated in regulation of membrane protease activity
MFNAVFWWAIFGVILMFCELALPGLILFFFGIGALFTAGMVWLFPLSLTMQITVFLLASLAFLFSLRRWLHSIFMGRSTDETKEALPEGMIGEEGRVSQTITPSAPGKIILHGTAWTAEADEDLEEGAQVEIIGQKSLTLKVKRKEIQKEAEQEEGE